MAFLSFDPGGAIMGWAFWSSWEHGHAVLIDCGLLRAPKTVKDYRARAAHHSRALIEKGAWTSVRVGEAMVVRGFGSKEDPQDIVNLSLISGHLGTHWYTPGEWKGNLPAHKERERTLARLTLPGEAEAIAPFTKIKAGVHVISAVGIGLYHCGRGWK